MNRLEADFISTVSHELRTPLSSIAGALGLIAGGATGNVNEETAEMVDIALANSKRLILLINDLLDIEKLKSGQLHFEIGRHSLRALAAVAIGEISPIADLHDITVTLEAGEGDDVVCVDSQRIGQVFQNLLSNAIKFSPDGGRIEVRILADSAYHRIDFVDYGPGVPPEFRDRMFEKFSQADASATRRAGGTGLGLAISRDIVQRLDGKLRYQPNPAGGAVFVVELPAAPHLR